MSAQTVLIGNDINSVIEEALFFNQQIAKREHTNIETRFDRNLPGVMVDADQLQQVFINIAINAIQALRMANGNQTKAAKLLGLSRDALRYRMQKFALP